MGYDGTLRFNTSIDNGGFQRDVSSLQNAAKSGAAMVAKAFAAIGTGVGVAAAAAIKMGSDFEAGMSKVSATSGAVGDELESLTAKAKEMGEKTKFSATESAEAFNYMAMAGWKTGDMLNGIDGIMNLAAASGENLGLVSDIVTDALTAFGLKAADSGHFADVLAKASSSANTNVALMGGTFKYVAPVAGAMRYSIEDTALAIGLMANAGLKGEQAGTSLRSMFARLASPPRMAAKALDELGYSAANADGSMKPLKQVLQELREKFTDLNEEQQIQYAKSIAGTEAMSGFLAIINASEDDFNKLADAVDNADGAAASMAKTMNDNLKGQITILGSTLEGLGIKVFDKFEKPLKKAAESAIESVGKISKSMSSGKLSKSVDNLAESTGRFLSAVAELVAEGLPAFLNGLSFVIDNGRTIGAVLLSAAAAVGVFKTAMVIDKAVTAWNAASVAVRVYSVGMAAAGTQLTAFQLVVGTLTGRMQLATAAHAAWNLVTSMSPVGVLAIAVTAAAAAFTIFAIAMENEQSETEKFIERGNDLIETINGEKEARETLQEAREESINNSISEIDYIEQQTEKLQGLIGANGKMD